ncbi:hypothetical protein PPL_09639 [Heterostelium album PN500]|uniref:Pesticidal crystal protein domain-containing protein n=1 Tax=Heterostelium pallidum (strain ATCC 26659 / Pp 5 / PN500) TaxID=670386 RepID=D3BNW8_HETP5|nr:hypothetical protein PPL_09639 [Heterostelium album PN500]EFA76887.1 hypothetical protein PPL_09639 [Heterostelium album PN500]|eukprot:XP_020429019.1 hypothetical protein PPL_09639 [Heterostelium album PN500]
MATSPVFIKPSIPDELTFDSRWKQLENMLAQRTLKSPDQGSVIDTFKTTLTTALGFIPKVGMFLYCLFKQNNLFVMIETLITNNSSNKGGYISGVTDIFFTYLIENDKAINNSVKSYRSMLIAIVDKNITQYDDAALKASIYGCALSLKDFQSHVLNLRGHPNNASLKQMVRIAFMNLENDIECKYIFDCTKQKYLIEELPMYTYFATAHLSLLREAAIYGKDWGFDDATIKYYIDKFAARHNDYVDHCQAAYDDGYAKITKSTANNKYTYDQWNALNKYRNFMITTVFDFVNIWWLFDPRFENKFGAYVEYCRTLHSDLFGATIYNNNYDHTLDKITNAFDNQKLYQYKNELYKIKTSSNEFRINSFQPFYNVSDTTYGVSLQSGNQIKGTLKDTDVTVENVWTQNQNTTKVKVCHDLLPRYFEFLDGGVTPKKFGMDVDVYADYPHEPEEDTWYDTHTGNKSIGGRVETVQFDGHRLCNIYALCNNSNEFYTYLPINPTGGTGVPIGNSEGATTGIGFSFINQLVCERNIIYDGAYTVIDPQKYLYSPAPTGIDFKADGAFPGGHQIWLKKGGSISYNFDPYDSRYTTFAIHVKLSAKASGKLTITNKNNTTEDYSWTNEVKRTIILGDVVFSLNQTPGSNIFTFTTDANLWLEAFIFKPTSISK